MKYAESNPNWKHVDEFFFELKDNSQLVPTEIIKDWLTAEKIHREVNLTGGDYNWMHSFKNYFPEAHNLYEKLLRYTQTNGSFYYTSTWLGDIADEERENAKALVSYLKNLERYHEILKTNDNELIAQTSYELFVVSLGNIEIIRDDLFDVIIYLKELGEGVTKYFVEAHKNLGSDTIQQWDPIWNHIIATHGKHLIEVPKSETLSKF
jgi:hypothetical protein